MYELDGDQVVSVDRYAVAWSALLATLPVLRQQDLRLHEAREHLRVFLIEAHALDENGEIDWASSPAVRNLGKRLGISDRQPCQYCGERILSAVTPLGRPRSYCSNACRQAGPLAALRIRALSWRRLDRRRGTYFD